MDNLLKQAQDMGMSESQAKDSLGGVFSVLKSKLGEGDFNKILQAIPCADTMATEANEKNRAGGNSSAGGPTGGNDLLSGAMSMLGGSGGGQQQAGGQTGTIDGIGPLLGFLGKLGVDPKQLTSLLPMVSKFLSSNANVDTSSALNVPGGGGGAGGLGDLANQAQGLLGKFGK